MNSEESQTQENPEQEQEQQLPVAEVNEQQLQPESVADSLAAPEAEVGEDELPQPETEKLPNLEEPTTKVEITQQLEEQESVNELAERVAELKQEEQQLREKIIALQTTQNQLLSEQLTNTQTAIGQMVQSGLSELEQRKQALLISVEQLERRRERIRTEMRTTFAGVSQDLAIRVQGFKDYLVGSLQDLAAAAEQLELAPPSEPTKPSVKESQPEETTIIPKFAEQGFQEQVRQIRSILDQYRKMPDYYGPAWQLRRTFEPIHAERVSNWFFSQAGRGALRTMGSRLQNILVAAAVISVLRTLYGDRLRTLVLANTPERLGEWRRGLQDCLGISRSDFGPERGVVLFEETPALVQKADRLVAQKQLPLILIDETEEKISLSLLQFPLWLAFAPDPQQMSTYDY